MRNAVASAFAILTIGVISGCVESTWTYTLNPDGSGKARIDALLQPSVNPFDHAGDPFRDELYLGGSVCLWLGERDDDFDVDVEADVRLVAGLRF